MNALSSTAGLVLAWFASSASAQQNMIANGSFESGAQVGVEHFPGWDLIGPASNNSNYGTAQSGSGPDVAQQGSFYAYFHGHPTDSSQDCLGQTLNLTVGRQYTVSYWLGTDGPTLGSGAAMYVVIGTSFGIDLNQDVMLTAYTPNAANALPYQQFTTTVTATAPSEILSFHAFDAASSILLDDVSVTPVPAAPRLELSLSRTNTLVFSWTFPAGGYRLEANSSLGTTNWLTLTNAPETTGATNQIILPAPSRSQFYRLSD